VPVVLGADMIMAVLGAVFAPTVTERSPGKKKRAAPRWQRELQRLLQQLMSRFSAVEARTAFSPQHATAAARVDAESR
jgi:hypothetical protein